MSDVKPLTEQEEKRLRDFVTEAREQYQEARDTFRLFATLDALRAELATVTRERDRYKAEAMAAREAFDAARKAAIELCDMNGMAGRAGDAYRAIRAANVKAEVA